jgi:hypothetical protein
VAHVRDFGGAFHDAEGVHQGSEGFYGFLAGILEDGGEAGGAVGVEAGYEFREGGFGVDAAGQVGVDGAGALEEAGKDFGKAVDAFGLGWGSEWVRFGKYLSGKGTSSALKTSWAAWMPDRGPSQSSALASLGRT